MTDTQRADYYFQEGVKPWLLKCFGPEIAADKHERNHRFIEEALELVQSTGCTASEAHQLVDYVFGRDVGDPKQEVGGVMVTLAALCLANDMDMHKCGDTELARVWTKVEAIRAKQAAKPKHSPLPQTPAPSPTDKIVVKKLKWQHENVKGTHLTAKVPNTDGLNIYVAWVSSSSGLWEYGNQNGPCEIAPEDNPRTCEEAQSRCQELHVAEIIAAIDATATVKAIRRDALEEAASYCEQNIMQIGWDRTSRKEIVEYTPHPFEPMVKAGSEQQSGMGYAACIRALKDNIGISDPEITGGGE